MECAFRVNLYRGESGSRHPNETVEPKYETVASDGIVKSRATLSDAERNVLRLLGTYPNMTQIELAQKIGVSLSTVKRMLPALRRKGVLSRVGGDRYGTWIVK